MEFYNKGRNAIESGVNIKELFDIPVMERIGRAKYTPEEQVNDSFNEIETELDNQIEALISKEVE